MDRKTQTTRNNSRAPFFYFISHTFAEIDWQKELLKMFMYNQVRDAID